MGCKIMSVSFVTVRQSVTEEHVLRMVSGCRARIFLFICISPGMKDDGLDGRL